MRTNLVTWIHSKFINAYFLKFEKRHLFMINNPYFTETVCQLVFLKSFSSCHSRCSINNTFLIFIYKIIAGHTVLARWKEDKTKLLYDRKKITFVQKTRWSKHVVRLEVNNTMCIVSLTSNTPWLKFGLKFVRFFFKQHVKLRALTASWFSYTFGAWKSPLTFVLQYYQHPDYFSASTSDSSMLNDLNCG